MKFRYTTIIALLHNFFAISNGSLDFELLPKHIAIGLDYGGKSHVKYLFEISNILIDRGHTITYASFEDTQRHASGYNLSRYSFGASPIKGSTRRKRLTEFLRLGSSEADRVMWTGLFETLITSYESAFPKFIEFFKQVRPDLVICDFFAAGCRDAARQENIPMIVGFQSIDLVGLAQAPFITQKPGFQPTTTSTLGLWDRFDNIIIQPIWTKIVYAPIMRKMNNARYKYNFPTANNPFRVWDNALWIANTYFDFEVPRPLPSNLKLIGPVITPNPTPLTQELQQFVDKHSKILFIAFGSNVILSDGDIAQVMNAALMALDEDVFDGMIWGLGRTELKDFPESFESHGKQITSKPLLDNRHDHIRILPWAPQQTLLSQKHVRMFISHGGLESAFESLHFGTPILTYPFFSDQLRNGRRMEELGVGDFVNRLNTSSSEVLHKMKSIVHEYDHGFVKQNLRRLQVLSRIGSRRQFQAADIIEEYAYIVEACRMRNIESTKDQSIPCELRHLIPISEKMSFIKSNAIDVYMVALIMIFVGLLATCTLITSIFKFLANKLKPRPKIKRQ